MERDREIQTGWDILNAAQVAAELVSHDRAEVRFRIRKRFGSRLSTVVFSREALQHLAGDPDRGVKIEYLGREIGEALPARHEFRYPRTFRSGYGLVNSLVNAR